MSYLELAKKVIKKEEPKPAQGSHFVEKQPIKKFPEVNLKPSEEKPIWKNPYPAGTLEARKHSLSVVMDAMLEQAIIDIETSDYRYTPEVLQVENEAKNLYFAVLERRKTLADFRQAVEAWERVCT